ncbi:MAG: xanthine dehydrogenase family protein subunit M [Vicinamibacterales bacterium]
MNPFELIAPLTLDETLNCLDPDDPGVRVMAGGTALMLLMKARLFQPTRVVSLHRLRGALRGVQVSPQEGLRIGALTTLTELEQSASLRQAAPVLSYALATLSNVRIRNVATLGGHLVHGDPHMDLPPILMTLGARVRLVSARGERWLACEALATGYYETAVARDELLTDVVIPPQPADVGAAYAKFTSLSADDWPAVGVAVWVRHRSGRIADARIAVSAATDRPLLLHRAAALLHDCEISRRAIETAAEAAAEDVEPLSDIRGSSAYKREMIRVHLRRALHRALGVPLASLS